MRVAAIQPYFLPYVGYFELLEAADVVVILDDVQFKRRGWINRNRIRDANRVEGWRYLTIPVRRTPLETRINEIELAVSHGWAGKVERGLRLTYGREVSELPVVRQLIGVAGRNGDRLLTVLLELLEATMQVMGINTSIRMASELDVPGKLRGAERIMAITRTLGGTEYVNLPGGSALYDQTTFSAEGLDLRILPLSSYRSETTHIPHLSVLDGLLAGEAARIRRHLREYVLT